MPWERRHQLGPVSAFTGTLVQSVFRPAAFFRAMDPVRNVGAALFYAIAVGWLSFLFGALWEIVLPFHWPSALGSLDGHVARGLTRVMGVAYGLIMVPILVPIGVFVISVVYHGLLILFGGARRGFETTVRTDGMISFPLLGDVRAGGVTPDALATTLGKRLERFVEAPKVTVSVLQANSARFYVLGQVAKPGEFPLGSRSTVLQALALAGGFKEFAKPDSIVIVREDLLARSSKSLPTRNATTMATTTENAATEAHCSSSRAAAIRSERASTIANS